MNCLLLLSTTTIHSYATDTTIHATKIGEQKIGEEHSAKNSPAKNMTRRKVRNPIEFHTSIQGRNQRGGKGGIAPPVKVLCPPSGVGVSSLWLSNLNTNNTIKMPVNIDILQSFYQNF